MIYGRATVEVVVAARDVCGHEVTEHPAFGIPGLVWAKLHVRHFVKSGTGFTFDEIDHVGTSWVPIDNVRNFQRHDD